MRPEIYISDRTYHNPEEPDPKTFTLENMAIPLGNICRWGGHIGGMVGGLPSPIFYSVAEHQVLGARYYIHRGETEQAKKFLLHDGGEPFIGGDIATPLKRQLPKLNKWEGGILNMIQDCFSLDGNFDSIKEADKRICRNESVCLFDDSLEYLKDIEPLYFENGFDRKMLRLFKWTPKQAAVEWYTLAKSLGLENKYA